MRIIIFTAMIVLPVIIALFLICLATLIIYIKWTSSYWSKKKVFTLPISFPFGNASDQFLGRETIGKGITNVYNEAKARGLKYAGFIFFLQPIFVPVDLELIRNIMILDFQHFTDHSNYINEKADPLSGHLFNLKGAKWKALRAKLSPLFSSGKQKIMFQTLVDCTKDLPMVLDETISNGEPIDIKETFARYTTDIIGSLGFGIECNCLKNPDNDFRRFGRKALEVEGFEAIKLLVGIMIPKVLEKINASLTKKDVEKFFLGLIKETVGYRDANKIDRKDFLNLLIKLRDEDIKIGSSTDNNEENGKLLYYQKGLSMEEIAAQAFVLFLAGFETSSTTLNFFMYELAIHPHIQDKLRKEIIEVLGKHHGKITYEAVQEMTYLDMCIYETLRKYPPLPALMRECTKEYNVPNSDLIIEKGTFLMLPVYGIQHDPEIYPDPEKFDPERFSDENKRSRSPVSFLSFGEGPRICIGLRLGLLQLKVGLIAMLRDYKFSLDSKTKEPLELEPQQFILTVKGGVWVNVTKI